MSSSSSSNGSRSQPDFQYDSIDKTDPGATRFFRINSNNRNGLIDCEMWHGSSSATFIVISHIPGPVTGNELILLNGRPHKVSRTLWECLLVAKTLFVDKTIWIDTVCVDMTNDDERDNWARLAPQIYFNAKTSFIWLGPHDFYVCFTLKMIDTGYFRFANRALRSLSEDDRLSIGISEILSQKIWSHTWGFLAFVLPTKCYVMQGHDLTSLDQFYNRWSTIRRNVGLSNSFTDSKLERLQDARRFIQSMKRLSLIQQNPCKIVQTQRFPAEFYRFWWSVDLQPPKHCSDIRDRLYSMLTFTSHGSSFRIDLNLNPFEVFLESLWLEYDSSTMVEHIQRVAWWFEMTPATIKAYTQPSLERFRMAGELNDIVVPDNFREMHRISSMSEDHRNAWKMTGFAMPDAGRAECFTTENLLELLLITEDDDSRIFCMPKKCQRVIASRIKATSIFLVLGVHLSDDDFATRVKQIPEMSLAVRRRELTDPEFLQQDLESCYCRGLYQATCSPSRMTVYYAVIDGSLYTRRQEKMLQELSIEDPPRASQLTDHPPLTDTLEINQQHELATNDGPIETAVFSTDGTLLATCARKHDVQSIRLWDTATASLQEIIVEAQSESSALAFSTDSKCLAFEGRNNEVWIWHIESDSFRQKLVADRAWGQTTAIRFSPLQNHCATSNAKRCEIQIWDPKTGKKNFVLGDYGHFEAVVSLSFTPDGRHLVSGSLDRSVLVWDVQSQQVLTRLKAHRDAVSMVEYSLSGNLIASCDPSEARIWSAGPDSTDMTMTQLFAGSFSCMALSPCGRFTATVSRDAHLCLWDNHRGTQLVSRPVTLTGGTKTVAFAPDGKFIVTGSDDTAVRLWRVEMATVGPNGASSSANVRHHPSPALADRQHSSWSRTRTDQPGKPKDDEQEVTLFDLLEMKGNALIERHGQALLKIVGDIFQSPTQTTVSRGRVARAGDEEQGEELDDLSPGAHAGYEHATHRRAFRQDDGD